MEFRQLRYFVAIAEAGSLGKASERLRVAQPALSLQLANLEARLGTELFERYHRGVKLTQAGTLLLRHAELILQAVADATQAVRRGADSISGRVSIGFPTTVSDAFIGQLLQRAAAELPDVHLRVAEHSTAHLADLLGDGSLDLAVLMNAPDQTSVSMQRLLLESYCLVSPPREPATETTIDWAEATMLPLILPSPNSTLRLMLEDAALQAGRRLQLRAELDSARLLKAAVRAGFGHSILPRSSLLEQSERPELRVRLIVNPELRSLLQLASSTTRPATPAQMAVRELLTRLIRKFVCDGRWQAELHESLA